MIYGNMEGLYQNGPIRLQVQWKFVNRSLKPAAESIPGCIRRKVHMPLPRSTLLSS